MALRGVDLMHFLVALFALGVGWNFLFIGGTTLFTEAYRPEEKTTRAGGDGHDRSSATMTITSFSSGALVTTQGWTWLNLGSIVPVALIGAALLWYAAHRRAALRTRPRLARFGALPRAEPATRSKRNSRHSIGPFHIGTRRDSFSRIALGSFMSGLRIQAVQPAGCCV